MDGQASAAVRGRIIAPEVEAARRQLLSELRRPIEVSGASRDACEAQLGKLFAGLWNEAEVLARQLRREPS
jgi:hypothetical protein